MDRHDILLKANEYIMGDRQENYGDPEKNFDRIATFWTDYLGIEIKTQDVAAMMILLKLARIQNNPAHLDSWIDICGYAANGGELINNG